jgi:hypothetical protein
MKKLSFSFLSVYIAGSIGGRLKLNKGQRTVTGQDKDGFTNSKAIKSNTILAVLPEKVMFEEKIVEG